MNKKLKVSFSKNNDHFDNVELIYGDYCLTFIVNNSDHYSKVVHLITELINSIPEEHTK